MNNLASISFFNYFLGKFLEAETVSQRVCTFLNVFESTVFQKGYTNYNLTSSF